MLPGTRNVHVAGDVILAGQPSEDALVELAKRVGALWLAHRVKQGRMAVPQARAEAAQVGLRTEQLEEKSLEYLGH